jgi:hypothetical protein
MDDGTIHSAVLSAKGQRKFRLAIQTENDAAKNISANFCNAAPGIPKKRGINLHSMSPPTIPAPTGTLRRTRPVLWILLLFTALTPAAPLGITIPLLNGNLEAPYILESDPERDALRIAPSARIVRNQIGAPVANVTVRWRATLRQGTTTIAQTSHTTVVPVTGVHDAIVNTAFELNPPTFLNDAATYSLFLEVHHINDPAVPATFTAGDTTTLSLLNFGHFSGVVNFGTNQGTLSSFGNPAPHYLGAAGWQLTVFAGTLSNGLAFANSTNSTQLTTTRSSTTGDLTVTAGSAEIDDGNGQFTWGAWSGVRGPVLISSTGIAATNFRLTLPPGVGWRDGTTGVLRTVFRSETVALPLTAALAPAATSVSGAIPAGREFVGSALPVAFTPPTFKFDGTVLTLLTPGTRFLRHGRYTQVAGQLPRSNDSYFRFLRPTAGSDLELRHNPAGAMTVTLRTDPGDYTTHFPDGDVGGLASSLRVMNDAVVTTGSSLLANWVHLQYDRGCSQAGGAQHQGMRILAPTLTPTPQGGIMAVGNLATDFQFPGVDRHLEIGRNGASQAVHETDEFTQARFYAPGFSVPQADTPADFLLAEIRSSAPHTLGFPGSAAYAAGLGLYAGFNFDYPNAMHVRSRTGGASPFDYEVAARRAYARWSGVSGVIQAQPAELPFQADIYGFPIGFTDWAFNFLSNEMRDTFIQGQVDLTGTPADFTQGMEDVRISCCGNLERFEIPQGEADKRLGYWDNFEISNSSARFATPAPCDSSEAVLVYATTVQINGLPGRKAGQLGFLASGRMTVPNDDAWDYAPSFLSLEPQSGVAGQYFWWPRGDAFFNNPDELPAGPGFVTAAGDLETPFFTLDTVRIHTTAVPEVDDEVLVGFLHGDYLAAGAEDLVHRGTPAGMNPAEFSISIGQRPTATAAFFGKEAAWEFPVVFNVPTGNFHSPDDGSVDLWVAEFPGRITRLNAEIAQVKFGKEIEGFTELTVGNLVEEAAAYGAQGVAQVIGGQITGPIKDGLLSLAELLDNKLEKALGDAVDAVVTDRVDALIAALRQMESANTNWNAIGLNVELNETLGIDHNGPLGQALRALRNFQDGLGQVSTGIGAINTRLLKLETALNCIVDILSGDAGAHDRLGPLYDYVVDRLNLNPQIEIEAGLRAEALNAVLADAGAVLGIEGGWLADARDAIVRLRDIVVEIRGVLGQGQEFLAEVSALFDNIAALDEITSVVVKVQARISTRLLGEMQGRLYDFEDVELENIIRSAIRDELFNSLIAVNLQSMLRARFGYLDGLIQDAINTALQAFTRGMIEALEESNVLDALNTLTQQLSGPLSAIEAARIVGEAVSTGDRLRELSLMAQVDFNIPTGTPVNLPMSAEAMLKYYERIADADTACGPAGVVLPEVILKASGGSAIGFGADSRASIAVKFGFDSNFNPRGFAGAFQIDSSEFNVSGMGMQDFTGTLALGADGFYLSAHALGSFGAGGVSIDLEGGFFVGTTCDGSVFAFYPNFPLQPGGGPYSGVVAHLSGKAPLIGGGGLLNVTLGAEIGGFVLPGQGAGGHLGGSISGEALYLLKATGFVDLGYDYGGGTHTFNGEAGVEVKLGFKPFQITKSKTLHVVYIKPVNGSGDWQVNP